MNVAMAIRRRRAGPNFGLVGSEPFEVYLQNREQVDDGRSPQEPQRVCSDLGEKLLC